MTDESFDPSKGDFAIQVPVVLGSSDPARVFESAASLIRALQGNDTDLAQSIHPDLVPELRLRSIEVGSLRAWLSSTLKEVPDEELRKGNWKAAMGPFLIRLKYAIIRFLDRKGTSRIEKSDLDELRAEFNRLKKEVEELRVLPVQPSTPRAVIVKCVQRITSVTCLLPADKKMSFLSSDGTASLGYMPQLADEQVRELIRTKHLTDEREMSVKVKKPDYLGNSMWDVIVQGQSQTVPAKMEDAKWLSEFHARRIDLRPGDALLAVVKIDVYLDEHNEEIDKHVFIKQVNGIIREEGTQLDVFDDVSKGNEP